MTPFVRTTTIRFAHCDPAGIVFFPQFLTLVNEMVEDWFAGPLACSFRKLHCEDGRGVPTVRLECDFIRAIRLGDQLEQKLTVAHLGGSSCKLLHEAATDGTPVARFKQTLAYLNLKRMRAEPWPANLRAAMTPFMEAAA